MDPKKACYDICLILLTLVHLLLGLTSVGGLAMKINGVDGDGSTLVEKYAGLLIFQIYFWSICIALAG